MDIRTKISVRSYLTAGVAALGAGAIVMAPVQPLPEGTDLTPALRSSLAVDLAASIDPITPWVDTFQTATQNIERIITAATSTPLPIITQVITNFGTYLAELPDIGTILGQVVGNVGNALGAPFAQDPTNISPAVVAKVNISGFDISVSQQLVFALLPDVLGDLYESIEPILNFTTSPISGVLLGAIGPVVAPVVAVVDSLGAIVDALGQSDFEGAINELINIPANAVNAFLNGGQFLDLAPVLSLVGVTLPDSISNLGFNMPGILSTGISPVPPAEGADADPVAGVMFDGLAFTADLGLGAPITDPGLSVGPIGALVGLNQKVAEAIVVTPPAEAPAEIAAAEAPMVEGVEVEAAAPAAEVAEVAEVEAAAPVAAPASAPEVTPVEVEAPESAPAQPVAAQADTTPAAPRTALAGRGGDTGASASTPKRSPRGAAARG